MTGLSSYGLVQHEEVREVNLLRERTALHRSAYRLARRYVFGLTAVLAANLVLLPPLWQWGRVEAANVEALKQRVAQMDGSLAREKLVSQRLSGVQATADRRAKSKQHLGVWVNAISMIDGNVPADAMLNKSVYAAKPGAIEVSLFGTGRSIRTASTFTTLVAASPLFGGMRLTNTRNDGLMGAEGVQFEMTGVMSLKQ